MFNEVIPLSLQVVAALSQVDESKAVKVMEFIDGLLDCVIQVVLPHVKTIITTCLQIAKATTVGEEIRIKALSFIGEIVSRKKKVSSYIPLNIIRFELLTNGMSVAGGH